MNTLIYLVRHGEVQNPNDIFYSRLPGFGLSEKGKQEAAQAGEFLKKVHIACIYASPLLRAKQTAEIIRTKTALQEVYYSKRLLEVRSSQQGKKFSELGIEQREVYFSPKRTHIDETFEQIAQRGLHAVEILAKKHPGKRIVAISHGDVIMMLRSVINGYPAEYNSVRAGNGFTYVRHCEVLELTIDDNGKRTIKSVFIPSV